MEIPEAVLGEGSEVSREWEWAETFLKNPTGNFNRWLSQRLIDEVPSRTESRESIRQRFEEAGLLSAFDDYRRGVFLEWGKYPESRMRVGGVMGRFNFLVQTELMWRLAEPCLTGLKARNKQFRAAAGMAGSDGAQISLLVNSEEGMEFLPPWMRWVANHPLQTITEADERADDVLLEISLEYNKKCPNQAAKNWLRTIRGNPSMLADFWKQVGSRYTEEVRRTAKKPDAQDEGEEYLEQVKSLEEMLGVDGSP